jgi:hypothetical protein
MNISSTRQVLPAKLGANESSANRQTYKESLDQFNEIAPEANDRYQRRSSLVTNITPIPAAIGLIGGTAALWSAGEPLLDKVMSSVHPVIGIPLGVVAILGPPAAGIYGALKGVQVIHEKVTANPAFDAVRVEHREVREDYRNELLKSANDEGIEEILNPRWASLKSADEGYYHVGGPVGKEVSLNHHVNELEWLLDMRQQDDWRGEIAREQDDPKIARRLIREAADDPR